MNTSLNAQIKVEGRRIVTGPVLLQGAKWKASDYERGAALVIARINGQNGITEVTGLEHIDRVMRK